MRPTVRAKGTAEACVTRLPKDNDHAHVERASSELIAVAGPLEWVGITVTSRSGKPVLAEGTLPRVTKEPAMVAHPGGAVPWTVRPPPRHHEGAERRVAR